MQTVEVIEYRNAIYQGFLNPHSSRQGFGMLISDQSQVLVSIWSRGIISGPYTYIGTHCNAYGSMKDGLLTGFNVIQNQNFTIYGYFKNNLLSGRAILRSPQSVHTGEYHLGLKTKTLSTEKFNHETFLRLLGEWFPHEVIGVIDFLSQLAGEVEVQEGMTFREVRMKESYKYYGFLGRGQGKKGDGLAVKFKNQCLLSCGWHVDGELDGVGRLYCVNGELHDGVFTKGRLQGFGVKYSKFTEKYTVGMHEKGKIISGFGYPRKQIAAIHRELHLRSVHFHNSYIIFEKLINIDLDSLMMDDTKEKVRVLLRSPSPIRLLPQKSLKKLKDTVRQNPRLHQRIRKFQRLSQTFQLQQTTTHKPSILHAPIINSPATNPNPHYPHHPHYPHYPPVTPSPPAPKSTSKANTSDDSEIYDDIHKCQPTQQQILNSVETASQKTEPQRIEKTPSIGKQETRPRNLTEFKPLK